ncbi:MAG: hypothetical protein LBQ54_10150 [Planctomycetaceae bacterium]|jgi:hypothetical protein|nr:hypothetical protein [Planctomycetaceae bacterium]
MTDVFESMERMAWNAMKSFAGGGKEAVYRQGETEIPIHVVLTAPVPEGFAFEDFRLYKTSRIFEAAWPEFGGIVPKDGDTILLDGVTHTVRKTQSGPCYEHVGSYGVSVQIHTSLLYR